MVESGSHERNTDTVGVTGNSERTVTTKVEGENRKRFSYTIMSFLNKHLTKVSLIPRRVDRKLLMFSQRRLGRNLILRESRIGIVIT